MKYLKMELEGGEFVFRARGYSVDDDMRDEWCLIDLTASIDTTDDHTDLTGSRVSSKIDIRIENDESLMCCELHRLEKTIDEALEGKLTEEKIISPMEPYMQFMVSPFTPMDRFQVPCLQWRLYVWHEDSPTEQYFSICLCGEELEKLSLYLKYLRGEIDEKDDRLKDYFVDKIARS